MRNKLVCLLGIAACALPLSARAGRPVTETADFSGSAVPQGWTVSDGGYLSPEYSNTVSRIALSYGASGAGPAGVAQVFAIDHTSSAETQVASVNAATTGAAFDFPAASDYRRFRVATDGLALASFSATWLDARLDAPSNVVATALTTDSLEVSWDAVSGAASYRVSVWTNVVVGASAGNIVWEDPLPGATNGASSTHMSDTKFNACFAHAGWTRSDKAGYPTGEDGTIRMGITGESGWLQTPPIEVSDSGIAVVFHAKAGASNAQSMNMLVERVSGEDAVAVGEVALTTEMKEFRVLVPEWNSGDCIRFNSLAAGDRRTVLGAVALLSGYSAGVASPVVIKEVSVADAASCTVDGLPEAVPVFVGVSAVDSDGVPSERSAGVAVDLANPPPRAMLNACPVGGLAGDHVYVQGFDPLAVLTATSGDKDFYNGATLSFWQAWQDLEPATKLSFYAGGNQTGAKFVALAADINEPARAFGARGKQETTMTWGLAFTNDTGSAVALTNVSYSAQQWGFANTTNQLLSFECLVTNRLDWIVSFAEGWQPCDETEARVFAGTHDMPESTAVDYVPSEVIRIQPGEVLYLRWTFHPPAKGSSALMAIDDVRVRFQVNPSKMTILFR
ncbi:MAG: hypothetical protein IJL17_22840 [Kiritimatiellae bacterium]|nr:hypothetical protein [Kiritimatiellia bacterium]